MLASQRLCVFSNWNWLNCQATRELPENSFQLGGCVFSPRGSGLTRLAAGVLVDRAGVLAGPSWCFNGLSWCSSGCGHFCVGFGYIQLHFTCTHKKSPAVATSISYVNVGLRSGRAAQK